ncbi:inner membrane protein translocase component YidC, short form OxaI-like [Lachnospiraceae bacterium KM106-2]|nr:inner membrane protein translocase component YidC, short form OxaI-like [Lachnospiraceae bacterium KM106-2]
MSAIFLTKYTGVWSPIANLLGWILNELAEFLNMFGIMNTGLTIILFTIIINMLMIPLTIKQQKFSKLSSRMAPELSKIQKKYKNKKDEASVRKMQMETQAVYRKYGSSPTGGCLPLLITLPILLALYRVIYHIPAYVQLYYDIYAGTADKIMQTSDYATVIGNWTDVKSLVSQLQHPAGEWVKLAASNKEVVQHNLVELMSQFTPAQWTEFQHLFPAVKDSIEVTAANAAHVSSIFGVLSVVEQPGWGFPGIIIPLLAGGFQFLQTKLMTTTTPDSDNPAASTMKTMNTIMPISSIIMCAILPIGVGLYWIAGSVFRVIQQIFVNRYMDHIDVDKLIEKNVEKSNKRNERLGIDPAKMQEISKSRTSSIQEKTQTNVNKSKKKNHEPSDYKRSEVSYKSGSIAANANLLGKKSGEKGDK